MIMKTPLASILTMVSLSLALCACDSGDKKDGAAPPLPPKKPKTEDGGGKANPQPPEPTEHGKDMAPTAPAGPMEMPETTDQKRQLDLLNMALSQYAQKQMTAGMGKSGRPGGGKTSLTSLDQLVKAGIIKAIPEAPAGKKFVLDVPTQKVKLEPK